MEIAAKLFSVTGLILDIFGATLLAYGILVYSESRHYFYDQLEGSISFYASMIKEWEERLEKAPHERAKIFAENKISEMKAKRQESVVELESKIEELPVQEKRAEVYWAKIGLKLLISGFVFQTVGVVLS